MLSIERLHFHCLQDLHHFKFVCVKYRKSILSFILQNSKKKKQMNLYISIMTISRMTEYLH